MTAPQSSTRQDFINASDRYPSLGAAVKANDAPALKALIEHVSGGVDSEVLDVLLYAGVGRMSVEVAEVLVNAGANPRLISKSKEYPMGVRTVDRAAIDGNVAVMNWFIDKGHLDLNERNLSGRSVLTSALLKGQIAVADALFARGVNLNTLDFRECSALHLACAEYMVESIVWLVSHGADPTLETIEGSLASETIPEKAALGEIWNPEAIYEFLEDYREVYASKGSVVGFPVPAAVLAEVSLEKGDVSSPDMDTLLKNIEGSSVTIIAEPGEAPNSESSESSSARPKIR